MNCPSCREPIIVSAAYCSQCRFQFSDEIVSELTACFQLKRELIDLKSTSRQLSTQIKSLTKTARQLEYHIDGKLNKDRVVESKIALESQEVREKPRKKRAKKARKPLIKVDEVWWGQKTLLIFGIIATVFSIGYFLKYTFDQGWIGPAGRVALAYLAGIALLTGGDYFRRKELSQFGLALSGGGIATLYFATFAAFQIYDPPLLSQPIAFFLMILTTVIGGMLAVRYDSKWLAILGLIGGFLTPIMLGTGSSNQVALMTYMAFLNMGVLFISFFKQWKVLNKLGFILTYMIFTAWMINSYKSSLFLSTFIYLNIFFLTYSLAPVAYHLFRQKVKKQPDLLVILMNTFLFLGFLFWLYNDSSLLPIGATCLFYAALFGAVASTIHRHFQQQTGGIVLLLAKAILLLTITIPIIFSEYWVTIFWAIQTVTFYWVALRLKNSKLQKVSYLLIFITLISFYIDYFESFSLNGGYWYYINGYGFRFIQRMLTTCAVLGGIFSLSRLALANEKKPILFYSMFGVMLFIVLNIETSAFFHDYVSSARFAAISVLWALFATVLMIMGFVQNVSSLRKISLGLFGFTILKVFFVDMAKTATPFRILSFAVLGLLLIGASYLYHKYRDRIL
ncbi:MAG: hypothetical protein B6244_12880 [Candidatus Cloacimonetes bacterium 4572_55]|nr:MAG: hypothetical protein B6244_12880 [Candidatus Cloacimonetes bacterium 4572_55]